MSHDHTSCGAHPDPAPVRHAPRAQPARRLRAVRTFARDVRGIAAVEFGLIVPVLMLMLIGAAEISRAVSIDRRLSMVTATVADLVAREKSLTPEDVRAIYEIADLVMSPFDTSELQLSLVPVMSSADDAKKTRVYAAPSNRPGHHGGATPAECQAYALPEGLLEAGESVIVVEANYVFTPLIAGYVMSGDTWTRTATAKPRETLCVAFDGPNCKSSCF